MQYLKNINNKQENYIINNYKNINNTQKNKNINFLGIQQKNFEISKTNKDIVNKLILWFKLINRTYSVNTGKQIRCSADTDNKLISIALDTKTQTNDNITFSLLKRTKKIAEYNFSKKGNVSVTFDDKFISLEKLIQNFKTYCSSILNKLTKLQALYGGKYSHKYESSSKLKEEFTSLKILFEGIPRLKNIKQIKKLKDQFFNETTPTSITKYNFYDNNKNLITFVYSQHKNFQIKLFHNDILINKYILGNDGYIYRVKQLSNDEVMQKNLEKLSDEEIKKSNVLDIINKIKSKLIDFKTFIINSEK